MIVMEDVGRHQGSFQMKNISFSIPDGYICGLVGRNGAGKTTLMHLMLGLYRIEQGKLEIDGMHYPEQEKEIHDEIGTVLVEELFEGAYSLWENGMLYGAYYRRFKAKDYEELLQEFQLDKKEKFRKLSKGQKLKCQFAFALACHPKYLFLDEPTANFDPQFRAAFLKKIQEFVMDGEHTVLLATHMTEDLDRLADYLIYLQEGQILYAGDMESFREKYRIVAGENYKIKLLGDSVLGIEQRQMGTRALVRHHKFREYDRELTVTYPSIEEFMYLYERKR